MDNIEKFISSQKGEINAALMYKEFAGITKNEKLKKAFLEAAADEGRHATILSKYTKKKIKPQPAFAKLLGIVYRVLPKKMLMPIISKGEVAGGDGYKPFIKEYPEFEQMMNDEYKHAEIFKNILK